MPPKPRIPDTPDMAALREQMNRYRRQVRALTAGNGWLEKAAEVCADMKVNSYNLMEAILHARKRYLGPAFHELPLCSIERAMYRQGMNALVILMIYEVLKPALEEQLGALRRENDGRLAAGLAPLSISAPDLIKPVPAMRRGH